MVHWEVLHLDLATGAAGLGAAVVRIILAVVVVVILEAEEAVQVEESEIPVVEVVVPTTQELNKSILPGQIMDMVR